MSERHLYNVTLTVERLYVGASPAHAEALVLAEFGVEVPRWWLRRDAVATLATALPDGVDESGRPEWEYADTLEDDSDGTPIDPDRDHVRRAWTIRRWIAEQRREAEEAADPPTPAPASTADDWRGPPSPAEVAAHHAVHARDGRSLWTMRTSPEAPAVVVAVTDGALAWLPSERSLWRSADALLTPVAWPEVLR